MASWALDLRRLDGTSDTAHLSSDRGYRVDEVVTDLDGHGGTRWKIAEIHADDNRPYMVWVELAASEDLV